jgi:hypothetical protein
MSVRMCSPSWYLPIPAHLRLNPLYDFSGYTKIQPIVTHFEAHFANLGASWPFEDPQGAPRDPRPIFFSLFV